MSPIYSDRMKEFMKFDLGVLDVSAYPVEALDVPYMENGKFTYDFYRQDKTKKSPLIIVIHGGGWVSGYKRSKFMGPMIQPAFHGVAVAVLSYTLALEAPFPQSIYDIKTAIRYFRANADKLNIDADRIFIWGESAGSNVAALVGLTLNTDLHDLNQGYATVSEDLAGVIAHYGVFDLLQMNDHKKTLGIVDDWNSSDEDHYMTFWLGKPFDQDPMWTAKANPISYVKNNTVPFYLIHGLADTMVPYLQTVEFTQALCSQGKASVSVDYIVNAGHTDPLTFSPAIITKIVDFTHNVK
jgi:acetyl esterase/lipase